VMKNSLHWCIMNSPRKTRSSSTLEDDMTPEELTREEAWVRRMAEWEDLYDPEPILAAGLIGLMKQFPEPNTDGLSPEEAEAVLTKWRADVHAYLDARQSRPARTRS
jgi:hypothetical protein